MYFSGSWATQHYLHTPRISLNSSVKLVQPEQTDRSRQHTCQESRCVSIFLLTYAKITYFALGRISWPFLYHFSSTVGSASSTMNLTLPPLSTWYAGSRPLAKAVVEVKCYFNMRSENKNMDAEMTLHKSRQTCQNTRTQCYATRDILTPVSMESSRNTRISTKLFTSGCPDQDQAGISSRLCSVTVFQIGLARCSEWNTCKKWMCSTTTYVMMWSNGWGERVYQASGLQLDLWRTSPT